MMTENNVEEDFSKQQLQELEEAFSLFDKDGDGFITTDELCSVMRSLRQPTSEAEIKEMITQVDIDGNGKVSFAQFTDWMDGARKQQSAEDEMREAFAIFDLDGDGYINAEDIKRTMETLGENVTDHDVKLMVKEADEDGDERINFKEFVKMMSARFSAPPPEADSKYSPEERAEFKIAFSLFDKDKDGSITMDEVETVMTALGQNIPQETLVKMFNQVDLDGNGKIDYDEFVKLMESRAERRPEDAELRALFDAFDKDKSGYIDAAELKRTMAELGIDINDEDARKMLKDAGVQGDGRIYYEEFVSMMSGQIGQMTKTGSHTPSDERSDSYPDSTWSEDCSTNTGDLRVAFAMFDKDGDGTISSTELLSVMKQLGIDTDTKKVQDMIQKVDLDGNGTIEFEEFCKLMRKRKSLNIIYRNEHKADEYEMRQAFRVFDKDGSGYIDGNELQATMKQLGVDLTEKDVKAMLKEAGVGPQGRIYYEEFVKIMFGKILKPGERMKYASPGDFTEDQVQELRVAFSLFDKDGDGAITAEELTSVFKTLGYKIDDKLIFRIIDRFDYDGNGTLEFGEFLQVMKNKNSAGVATWHKAKETEPEAWKVFKVFDRDRNGYISSSELKHTMGELGLELTDEDAQMMIKEADLDNDGKINYKEFSKIYTGQFKAILGEASLIQQTQQAQASQKKKVPSYEEGLRVAFDQFDEDKDGCISAIELGAVMRNLGLTFQHQELQNMIKQYAQKGNGTVDFQEFLRMMAQTRLRNNKSEEQRKKIEEDEMRQAFKVFDIDGNGAIDAQELKLTMRNLGENLSDSDVRAMLEAADLNKDGKIDYEEFIRMMYNK